MVTLNRSKRREKQDQIASSFSKFLMIGHRALALKILPFTVNITVDGEISLYIMADMDYITPDETSAAKRLFQTFLKS